ncbi:MAG: hypothetical protein ACK41T_03740 [Pseudobdellovibrio sp.]
MKFLDNYVKKQQRKTQLVESIREQNKLPNKQKQLSNKIEVIFFTLIYYSVGASILYALIKLIYPELIKF